MNCGDISIFIKGGGILKERRKKRILKIQYSSEDIFCSYDGEEMVFNFIIKVQKQKAEAVHTILLLPHKPWTGRQRLLLLMHQEFGCGHLWRLAFYNIAIIIISYLNRP